MPAGDATQRSPPTGAVGRSDGADVAAEMVELQADHQQRLDGSPERLADTSIAATLRVVCDFDPFGLKMDPPRGLGRN